LSAQFTGLYYYRARYYHAGVARFISEDPLEFSTGDVNLYSYGANNPVGHVDPLGQEWQLGAGVNLLVGGGPFLHGPFVGGGMGLAVTSNGQLVFQAQATGAGGVGIYGGVGIQGGLTKTRCPTPAGVSVQRVLQVDANVGTGASYGGSVQYDFDKGGAVQVGLPRPRAGVGYGAQVSAGVTQIVTIPLTPTLFGRKPPPGCR
jgi:RHS repeat-associated protein